jgi:hypothetical protein
MTTVSTSDPQRPDPGGDGGAVGVLLDLVETYEGRRP